MFHSLGMRLTLYDGWRLCNSKELSRYFVSDVIAVVVTNLMTVPAGEPQVSCVSCSGLTLQEVY